MYCIEVQIWKAKIVFRILFEQHCRDPAMRLSGQILVISLSVTLLNNLGKVLIKSQRCWWEHSWHYYKDSTTTPREWTRKRWRRASIPFVLNMFQIFGGDHSVCYDLHKAKKKKTFQDTVTIIYRNCHNTSRILKSGKCLDKIGVSVKSKPRKNSNPQNL